MNLHSYLDMDRFLWRGVTRAEETEISDTPSWPSFQDIITLLEKDGYQSESTIFSESEAWISKVLLLLDDNGYLFPKQMALAPGATTAFDNFCQYLMMWPMQ